MGTKIQVGFQILCHNHCRKIKNHKCLLIAIQRQLTSMQSFNLFIYYNYKRIGAGGFMNLKLKDLVSSLLPPKYRRYIFPKI